MQSLAALQNVVEDHQSIALKYATDMDHSAELRDDPEKFHVRNVDLEKTRLDAANGIRKRQARVTGTRIGKKQEKANALALKAQRASVKKPMCNRVLPFRNVDEFI